MQCLKAVFPGKYIQGEGVIKQLPDLLAVFGRKAMIIATPSAVKRNIDSLTDKLPADSFIEHFNGECCETELSRLQSCAEAAGAGVIVAVGGGKTIDSAKIVADRLNCRVIIIPTIASTDAPCSGCAIIYSEQGVVQKAYYQKMNPDVVLVDSAIITKAPVRFLVSGMGDALATWFEARSCVQNKAPNMCGGLSPMAGLALAELCYKTLLNDGVAAKLACENNIVTPALDRIIEANTLLSGIGFESSGLAAAHSIHNGLTMLEGTHHCYHGEKVAFGVLAGLHLTGADQVEMDKVYEFCESIGLPTTFEDIGISGCSEDDLLKVGKRTCFPGECIHSEAGKITYSNVVAAMIAADAMGRLRNSNS